MFWYVSSSIAMGLSFLLIYFYYSKKGHFDDLEDVKYQLFHDERDETDVS